MPRRNVNITNAGMAHSRYFTYREESRTLQDIAMWNPDSVAPPVVVTISARNLSTGPAKRYGVREEESGSTSHIGLQDSGGGIHALSECAVFRPVAQVS
jgi:hypothetical protein